MSIGKKDYAAIAAQSVATEQHLAKVIKNGDKAAPARADRVTGRGYDTPGYINGGGFGVTGEVTTTVDLFLTTTGVPFRFFSTVI